jgi:type I restriction-modification system DNA methylase subunit
MMLSPQEIKSRALQFGQDWKDETRERAEKDSFWNDFFNVFGINRRKVADFEKQAKRYTNKQGGFIDVFWKGQLLAEHKSAGKDLDKTLDEQTYDYFETIPQDELPRFVMVSDFKHMVLENVETKERHRFLTEDLHQQIHLFNFMTGRELVRYKDEDPINIKAANRLGDLYDALLKNGYDEHANRLFLVRVMFLCYAEDIGIFDKDHFRWCLEQKTNVDGSDVGRFLDELFDILNTPEDKRQRNLDDDLKKLPYVNGSVFAVPIQKPAFDATLRQLLIDCCALDWTKISPAIFGSLFQAAMNKIERRKLGAHYTSEKNILKVISPLFLDELKAELTSLESTVNRRSKLLAFWEKLKALKLMDPACGTGNFLVIAYRELRLLEIQVIQALIELDEAEREKAGQHATLFHNYKTQLSVTHLYGIEIDELAVEIARLGLWVTDYQMSVQLTNKTGLPFAPPLPITHEPHIHHGNALRTNWDDVCPREALHYMMGNPPFIGKDYLNPQQKEDVESIFGTQAGSRKLDYVTCWHMKATQYMQGNPQLKVAFVSTNSICQGEQVGYLWGTLLNLGVKIHFAHSTFKWQNEAPGQAAVFCIVVGFGLAEPKQRLLFHYPDVKGEAVLERATNISPYLVNAPNIWVESRSTPIETSLQEMTNGSKPTDGGNLLLTAEERTDLIEKHGVPEAFIRPFIGGQEFINGIQRYCLWLKDVPTTEWRNNAEIKRRVEAVKQMREKSSDKQTKRDAERPFEFQAIRQPKSDYLVIPETSSENRPYIPMGFITNETIAGNAVRFIPDASLWHFGVLTSRLHMAWMRTVAGRLEGRYNYSNKLVYNNFPWAVDPTPAQIQQIEALAQAVLDARSPYLAQGATLADLYDPLAMPVDLRKAHTALDVAVEKVYRKTPFTSDAERVAFLFERYEALVRPLAKTAPLKKRRNPLFGV